MRYRLSLGSRITNSITTIGLEVLNEELVRVPISELAKSLLFPHGKEWRDSVIKGKSTIVEYLYTTVEEGIRKVYLRQDTGGKPNRRGHKRGSPTPVPTANLPRTVLSSINSAERPTVLMAKREMQSWRQLRLEPSALRRPDRFSEMMSSQTVTLDLDGGHLPATLHRLYEGVQGDRIKSRIRNRLMTLLDDIVTIEIDVDKAREQLSLHAKWKDNTSLPARSLSEGTLRFLALAVIENDLEVRGVICLEEPENGIHPGRLKDMIELLKEIAMDTEIPVSEDNPFRQIIINTHSPNVVKLMDDASILIAELQETVEQGCRSKRVAFSCIPATWRSRVENAKAVSKGKLLDYLNPEPMEFESDHPLEIDILKTKEVAAKPKPLKRRTDLLTLSLFEDHIDRH